MQYGQAIIITSAFMLAKQDSALDNDHSGFLLVGIILKKLLKMVWRREREIDPAKLFFLY